MQCLMIVGSHSYDLCIDTSDIDILWVGDDMETIALPPKVWDNRLVSTERFINQVTLMEKSFMTPQVLFPGAFVSNAITEYIKAVREDIIKANLLGLWNCLMEDADYFDDNFEKIYTTYPKKIARTILFFDSLAKYASNDILFEQVAQVKNPLREQLLYIRKQKLTLEEALELYHKKKNAALAVFDFYNVERNELFLEEVRETLKALLKED